MPEPVPQPVLGPRLDNPVLRALWGIRHVPALRWRLRRGFRFQGRRHRFLVARYNLTWVNERQVEVPIARHALRHAPRGHVLEVGNVLSHYSRVPHRVVDKYEKAAGVRNEDFLDHRPERPYDLVVSVSTFEHIGWDEPDRDPRKFRRALRHARGMLAPGGRMLVTVPLGYNPEVDAFVQAPEPGFEVGFLRRTGPGPGEWEEAAAVDPAEHRYGTRSANASAVAVITAGPDAPAPAR